MNKKLQLRPAPGLAPEEPVDISLELDDLTEAERAGLDSMEARAVVQEAREALKKMEQILDKKRAGRPKLGDQDENRYTVLLDRNKICAVQELAHQRRLLIKQVFDEALTDYIRKVEAEDGQQYL